MVPRIGLAVSTIGRPALTELLTTLAGSTVLPAAVAVANQSGRPLDLPSDLPYRLVVVESTGGISRGRNAAAAALAGEVDVIGFPNDDTLYEAGCLGRVADAFTEDTDVVACALVEDGRPRFELPPSGLLDRISIWRAIEPATFVRSTTFHRFGGFREDMGTGCPSPWQSGEGTDLFLKVIESGGVVRSRPDIHVTGRGERRDLDADQLVAKHRGYARGTGYVYRSHRYPFWVRARIVAAPWLRLRQLDPSVRLATRLALARSLGRVEGLLGRVLRSRPTPRRGAR
ncbi:Glycosyltransferase, GT2 family [Geodermatophilus aquaeductus]|uniref:Glycosyltransferase, GT2 family n=1 Tax=Geodermatophilus aquaeductus TaxID=1564161 RepID=A0A521FQN3_9ACTN|nr:Glycosyltransferase, GT2 family [Geodermatophilus aquaeductus]